MALGLAAGAGLVSCFAGASTRAYAEQPRAVARQAPAANVARQPLVLDRSTARLKQVQVVFR